MPFTGPTRSSAWAPLPAPVRLTQTARRSLPSTVTGVEKLNEWVVWLLTVVASEFPSFARMVLPVLIEKMRAT